MNAALLCPGDTLGQLVAPPATDVTIAVNRAALRWPVDWWVALGAETIKAYRDKLPGRPRIVAWRDHKRDYRLEWDGYTVEDLYPIAPLALKWHGFSSTVALVLACHLGASRIDVYGADWTIKPDYDGVMAGDRTLERWGNEIPRWLALTDWLAARGVTVERHNVPADSVDPAAAVAAHRAYHQG